MGYCVYACCLCAFDCVQVLNVLVSKSVDDPDFEEDAQFLHDKLKLSLQDLRYITNNCSTCKPI